MIRPSKVFRIFTILPYMAVTVSVAGLMYASMSMKIDGSNKAFATLITRQAVESKLDQEARDKRQAIFEEMVDNGRKLLEEAVEANKATASIVSGIDLKVSEGMDASKSILADIEKNSVLMRESSENFNRAARSSEQKRPNKR